MSYQAKYLNPLIQFGRMNFDLLLYDDAGQLPDIRGPKSFISGTQETAFAAYANSLISNIRSEQGLDPQDDIVPEIQLPEGVSL